MERKMYVLSLSGLTPDNVEKIFTQNYNRWLYRNSDKAIVNGTETNGIERFLMMLPNEKGEPNIKTCVVSETTKDGFLLTKDVFINEQLKKLKPFYEKSIGSEVNRELNLKLKIYIDFLNITLTRELSPQQDEKSETEQKRTELSESIKKHFAFFNDNCPRRHKQILNNTDYQKLIDWTIFYFENNFKIPEILEPIKVVNTNKTFVQLAFKYLFKELHKSSPYPESLFELYKNIFTIYSKDKRKNFEAVKNNDEVKKIMEIPY